jgi:phage-related protein
MSYDLGRAEGKIVLDYDGRGVRQATDDMGGFRDEQGRLRDSMGRYVKDSSDNEKATRRLSAAHRDSAKNVRINSESIAALAKRFLFMNSLFPVLAKGFGVFTLAQPAINVVAALLSSLLPIIAAVGAALPGIALGAAAAFGVLRVATLGVGDALKAVASGDAAKASEALAKLSPQARNFALAAGAALKVLKPLQQAMQNAFFSGTAPAVAALAASVNTLRAQALGASTGFNLVFKSLLAAANAPATIDAIRSALSGVSAFLAIIAPAIQPLITGFAALAGQAGSFAGVAAGPVAAALAAIGNFLAGIDLASVFSKAQAAITPLITLVSNLGSIFASVFGAINVDGAGALGVFGALVGQVAAFLKTAEGQSALQALATMMQQIAFGVGPTFMGLLKALAPVFVALAPLVGAVAQTLNSVLMPVFNALSPLLVTVANALTSSLAPVLPQIAALFATLAPVLNQVAGALGGALAAALPGIASAISSLLPFVGQLATLIGSTLAPILTALGPVIGVLAQVLAGILGAALQAVMPILQALLPPIAALVSALLPALIPILQLVGQLFALLAPILTPVINLLAAILVPVLKLLTPILNLIAQGIGLLVGWLVQLITPISNFIAKALSVTQIQATFSKVWAFIKAVVQAVVADITARVQAGIAIIKAVFSSINGVISAVIGFFARLAGGVASAIGSAISFVRGLPGKILGAIGDLGSLLLNEGKNIVQGLINGISGMAGKLASFVTKFIKDHIPGPVAKILGISSPSKVAAALGREVPAGLAQGILQGAAMVEKAVQAMVSVPTLQMNVQAASSALTATPINQSILNNLVQQVNGNFTAPAAPGAVGGGVASAGIVVNQTVNAIPGMSAREVADYSNRKLTIGIRTGASSVVLPEPVTAGV